MPGVPGCRGSNVRAGLMNVSTRVVPVPYMCQNASPAHGRFCRFFARPHRYRAGAGGAMTVEEFAARDPTPGAGFTRGQPVDHDGTVRAMLGGGGLAASVEEPYPRCWR